MPDERNIQGILAEVAEQAEQTRDKATKMHRSKRPPTDASQVYSIRIPVSRLGAIRRMATRYGIPPTSMLRSWILQRLDLEEQSAPMSQPGAIKAERAERADAMLPATTAVVLTHSFHREPNSSREQLERKIPARSEGRYRRMAER
jgi:hypothetical protein